MSEECVVVADQNRARLFIRDDEESELQELIEFFNPDCRSSEIIVVDNRRCANSDVTQNNIGDYKPEPIKKSVEKFARNIGDFLNKNRLEFDRLILLTPNPFLDVLRDYLPRALPRLMFKDVEPELVYKNKNEIAQFLES